MPDCLGLPGKGLPRHPCDLQARPSRVRVSRPPWVHWPSPMTWVWAGRKTLTVLKVKKKHFFLPSIQAPPTRRLVWLFFCACAGSFGGAGDGVRGYNRSHTRTHARMLSLTFPLSPTSVARPWEAELERVIRSAQCNGSPKWWLVVGGYRLVAT